MRPSKEELMRCLKPEPSSKEELAAVERLGPGQYEVFSERLNMIVAEAKEVFIRIGVSFMLHSGDLVVGIHTARGDLVTACLGTFLHTVTAQLPIKWIMRNFKDNPSVGIREGDIFLCNEATYGGIHNADQMALMPVFYGGELLAWVSAGVHQPETAACEPGGMPAGAKSRYDEGMCLTPIKIAENYRLKDDLVEMTINFITRAPRMQAVDLRARVAACDRLRTRLQQLAAEKGSDFVKGLFSKMIIVGEEGARAKIRRWPDGIYRTVTFLDTIGRQRAVWRVFLTARKEGDHITLDFTGTSPENDGSWNAMPWAAIAYCAVNLYAHAFHDLPACTGTLAPIDWVFPEGCVYSPAPDAAVSNSVLVSEAMLKVLSQVFSRMMFAGEDRYLVEAPIGVAQGVGAVAGVNQWGVPFADIPAWIINTTGQGGRADMDGMDSAFFCPCLHAIGPDNEETEINWPVLTIYQNHVQDSGGPGKYRGGVGGQTGHVVYGAPWVVRARLYNTGRVPYGQGLFGGYPANNLPWLVISQTNLLEELKSGRDIPLSLQDLVRERSVPGSYLLNMDTQPPDVVAEGSFFQFTTSGGHGYGDVLERDPDAVVEDVRAGVVSPWAARNVYRVAYDPEIWAADPETTEQIRKHEREDRLSRGQSYDDFEKEWLKKRPKASLDSYGSWPDARVVRPVMRI